MSHNIGLAINMDLEGNSVSKLDQIIGILRILE